jgi:DNA-binding winged helix-turn-helix (wHTH) protein
MAADGTWCFEPYRLEVHNAQLWCGTQALHLKAKAFDVLCYLGAHAGQLVTKDDLFAAIWPELEVSEGVLTNCVGELRKAMGDTTQTPRFIATVRGRGYRFIAPVTRGAPTEAPAALAAGAVPVAPAASSLLVGRETELHALRHWLALALQGQRQVVWVTGEAGMGKTTVVDAFLATTAPTAPLWVAWGSVWPSTAPARPIWP